MANPSDLVQPPAWSLASLRGEVVSVEQKGADGKARPQDGITMASPVNGPRCFPCHFPKRMIYPLVI